MEIGLDDLGWNDEFQREFDKVAKPGWQALRLIRDNKISYGGLNHEGREMEVILSGKVYHDASCDAELPAVGDWVIVEPGGDDADHVIRARLGRQSCFSRKEPGKSSEEQVIAANVDVVVVVTDAGPDFNPRRMERYFALIERCGCRAVVLINKSDLFPTEQNEEAKDELQALNPDAEIFITSAKESEGLEVVNRYLIKGQTVTVVGSSGVGKSTLINQLMGEDYQFTSETNEATGKGRHTTTARELIVMEGGGMLVDNPGMREIQMWTDETTLRESFSDIFDLAAECKFHDCKHQGDQGCAIQAAVASGRLDPERYESFLRLDEEIAKLAKRKKRRQMAAEKWAKRSHRVKARNLADRIELEKEERGET